MHLASIWKITTLVHLRVREEVAVVEVKAVLEDTSTDLNRKQTDKNKQK